VLFDAATRRPTPNADFVASVARTIPRTTKLLVGCEMGGRSQHACELLAAAGFIDVANVRGGFGGLRDPSGRVVVPGWRDAGLPVATGRQEAP
jgi:rhodanese-related sulfurtransferase